MTKHPPPPSHPHQPPQPPASNREKMKDAVSALMQQVNEQKAQTKAEVVAKKQHDRRKLRRRFAEAAGLFLVLIASVIWAIPRWRQPIPPPEPAKAEHDARKALVFAASLVDRYEQRTGRLPGSFTLVGVTLPGVIYTRVGDGYLISMRVAGRDLVFHKGDNPTEFVSPH